MAVEKFTGRLILKEIRFDQAYKRTVRKSNDRSGKVTLPYELINKQVYIVVES